MIDPLSTATPNLPTGEQLRRAMRRWVSGVAIVTSHHAGVVHGMTVNSFGSISLDPPLVTVTMNQGTRTCYLVEQSGIFSVTVLSAAQQALAERFAGRGDPGTDRMAGLDTFSLATGAPLIHGGLAFIDCQVIHQYATPLSLLFIGEVVAVRVAEAGEDLHPLVYANRSFSCFG